MSMMGGLTNELRKLEEILEHDGVQTYEASLVSRAAEAIEALSDKLYAVEMEQSNAYYNGGWIPCEERLPEEHDSIFAKWYGTDRWFDGVMWRKQSDNVLTTIELEDGTRITKEMRTQDGKWVWQIKDMPFEVLAWTPMPEPWEEDEP